MNRPTHYYITKWALSEGVIIVPADQAEASAERIAWPAGVEPWHQRIIYGNKGWHADRASAERDVESMKIKRRASLQKALNKLDKPVQFKDYTQDEARV